MQHSRAHHRITRNADGEIRMTRRNKLSIEESRNGWRDQARSMALDLEVQRELIEQKGRKIKSLKERVSALEEELRDCEDDARLRGE